MRGLLVPRIARTFLLTACRGSVIAAAATLLVGCATNPGKDDPPEDIMPFSGYSIDEIIGTGDEALAKGEYDRAIFIFMQALELEESAEIWYRVGITKIRLDDRTFAWRSFNQALSFDPEHAPSYEELGLLYVGLGQPEAAIKQLTRATEIDPKRWRAFNALGVLADMDKRYAEAVALYKLALVGNPNSAMLMNNIGYSHYLSGDLQGATNWFDAAIQAEPGYAPAVRNLGLLYARQGWYAEAVSTFKRVAEDPEAYNDVGYLAMRNGDYDEASKLLANAIRLSPVYYVIAYENLERVREAMKIDGRRDRNAELASNMSEVIFPDDHETQSRKVMPQALNIRSAPSSDGEIISYLKTGDEIEIIMSQPGWAFISHTPRNSVEAVTGWVNTRYLLSEDKATAAAITGQMTGSQVVAELPADAAEGSESNLNAVGSAGLDVPASLVPAKPADSRVTLPTVQDKSADTMPVMPIDLSGLTSDLDN
jgi:tetratricopeptide (TPR) repeat protein